MEIDPTETVEEQTGKFVIICAINAADKKPYPLVVDKTTGELRVNAEFTGDVIVDIDKADKFETHGKIDIDGNEQQLPAQVLKTGIVLKADSDNVGVVWIGDTGVVADDGMPLEAGESLPFALDNSDKVYLKGTNVGDKLFYIGG